MLIFVFVLYFDDFLQQLINSFIMSSNYPYLSNLLLCSLIFYIHTISLCSHLRLVAEPPNAIFDSPYNNLGSETLYRHKFFVMHRINRNRSKIRLCLVVWPDAHKIHIIDERNNLGWN